MTIPTFMMLTALYTPTLHSAALSTVALYETSKSVLARDIYNNSKLSYKLSSFEKNVTTTERFKHNRHNFDVNLEQINVRNLKWCSMSLSSDFFSSYKNLKVAQIVPTRRIGQVMLQDNSKQVALQITQNDYNTERFKSNFANTSINKIASHSEMKVSTFANEKWQESLPIEAKESEQTVKIAPLSSSPEELADAFTHKASSAQDAFTTEASSSFGESQE